MSDQPGTTQQDPDNPTPEQPDEWTPEHTIRHEEIDPDTGRRTTGNPDEDRPDKQKKHDTY